MSILLPEQLAALESAKQASLGQLLLKAARLFDERALQKIAAIPGALALRPAHTRLLPHIDFDGLRATALAERLGVTKQAIAPLVADLLEQGVIEQIPDPSDGRARLIRFTPRGLQGLHQGLAVLAEIDQVIAARIGSERAEALRDDLASIIALLQGDDVLR